MGLWDGLDSAEIFEQGRYFPPGFKGVVEIERCIAKKSRKSGQDVFIVETKIIVGNLDGWGSGTSGTWCQSMKNRNVAMNAIIAFICSCFGLDKSKAFLEREVHPYAIPTMEQKIVGAVNGLAGRIMSLETWNKTTEEKKEDFTVHDWDLMNYAELNLPDPVPWTQFRVARTPSGQGFGYPGQGYGAPPPPPGFGPQGIPPGAQISPDGRFYLMGGQWHPAPVMAPPPAPPPAMGPPPGAQRSPDGRHWWSGTQWMPV